MKKHGFRPLGPILAVAFALMVLAATAIAANLGNGGQAAKIKIEAQEGLATNATFTGQIERLVQPTGAVHMVLLVGTNISILCGSTDVLEGKLISTNEGLLKFRYLGCVYRQQIGLKEEEEGKEGKELAGCTVEESEGKGKGGILVTTVFLPKKHEIAAGVFELFVLFEGEPNKEGGKEPLATVYVGGTEECVLKHGLVAITGSVVGLQNGNLEEPTKLVSFNDAIQLLFQIRNAKNEFTEGDRLLYGTTEAILDGNITTSLTGVNHTGVAWAITP